MLHVQTILHPTDYSAAAEAALRHAVSWARVLKAELHLLHALSAPGTCAIRSLMEADAPGPDPVRGYHLRQMRRLTETVGGEGLDVRYVTAHGPAPIDAIRAYAPAASAGLVVLGTRGGGADGPAGLGQVALSVMRRFTGLSLFVHGDHEDELLAGGRILVYVDTTQRTRELMALARALARRFRAHLDLLCFPEDARPHLTTASALAVGATSPDARFHAAVERLRAEAQGPDAGVDVQTHERSGYPPEVLVTFARRHGSDLLLMATPAGSCVQHAPIERTAERVLQDVPCPVLAVNPTGLWRLRRPPAVRQALA